MTRIVAWWHGLSPTSMFVASFLLLIAIGTTGLEYLPGLYNGPRLSAFEAVFTITSAVCVNGLMVVDFATRFTFWGQLWLLIFIQLGGLGLFTLTALIIGALGQRLSLRSEMISGPSVSLAHEGNVTSLVLAACKFTFVIEGAGALLLWFQFAPYYGLLESTWHAVFHSVSAFCNAGFSTFSDSMVGYNQRPLALVMVSALVVIGGIGWLSTEETVRWWKARKSPRPMRLSTHTWSALVVSIVLLCSGFVLFMLFEWDGVLRDFGPIDKLANAWFMSAMPRTAGFVTVPYSEISNASAYLTILLMFIGGSPGSTAGGVKTTTLAVLIALASARVRGRRFVTLHDRSIPDQTVQRTVSLILMTFMLLAVVVFALSFTESHHTVAEARQNFLPQVFEAMAAFSTVGISMDVTGNMSQAGRVLILILMFVGRVGPLAFFAAISIKGTEHPRDFRPAHEDVIVG